MDEPRREPKPSTRPLGKLSQSLRAGLRPKFFDGVGASSENFMPHGQRYCWPKSEETRSAKHTRKLIWYSNARAVVKNNFGEHWRYEGVAEGSQNVLYIHDAWQGTGGFFDFGVRELVLQLPANLIVGHDYHLQPLKTRRQFYTSEDWKLSFLDETEFTLMAFGHPSMLLLSDEHANDTAVVTVKDFDGKFLTIELHVTAHLGASDINIVESCSLELHDVSQIVND